MLIALRRFFILHSSFFISPQRQYLIPVGCRAPVALHGERDIPVTAGIYGDAVFGTPFGTSAEVVYKLKREVDVGAGDDTARKVQAVGKHRSHHQQGGDILRTNVSGKGYFIALQLRPRDAQRWESFLSGVIDFCSEQTQRIYEDTDGTLLHALRSGDDTAAGCHAEIGGEETHGRPRCHNVYMFGIALQRAHHDTGIVAIAQIAGRLLAVSKGVQDKRTVTDTLGCRQLNSGVYRGAGGGNGITHSCIC